MWHGKNIPIGQFKMNGRTFLKLLQLLPVMLGRLMHLSMPVKWSHSHGNPPLLISGFHCRCQNPVVCTMAGITCATLKVLPCHVMVSAERVFPPNLNPTVNSQLLYSECAARESTNEVYNELYSLVEELKMLGGSLYCLFHSFHFPNEVVSNHPLQCTLARTTEVFTIFLSFYK